MSNLFKQYSVIEARPDVRMIDYNALAQEKLKKLAAKQAREKKFEALSGEGFQSLGAIVPQEEPENTESPQEVLQKAKDEADAILKKAKAQAENVLNDANAQVESIKAQAKEEGYHQGYEEGEAWIRRELENEYEEKQKELEKYQLSLQKTYDQEMSELEPMLLDTILTVVEKVFHIQFADKKDILLHLVENAVLNIEGCKVFRVRVGEEQRIFLERRREEILDQVGHDISLEILSDPAFLKDQCVIETDTGVFDCGMGVQLENLIRDLKSLNS